MSSRRRLLAIGGSAALAALAGCTDTPYERPQAVHVRNQASETRRVTLAVFAGERTVLEQSLELRGQDDITIEKPLPRPEPFGPKWYGARVTYADSTVRSDTDRTDEGFNSLVVFLRADRTVEVFTQDAG